MVNYYSALQVSPSSTIQEIREAYRRKVKEVHPDLHNGTPQSVEQMKHLIQAWEVLRDPRRREDYDRRFFGAAKQESFYTFNYPEFLREQNDSEAHAKLIFYDLLHDNPDEALSLYDAMYASGGPELVRYLGREDFMDCAFLLAEEYTRREEYPKAVALFGAIIRFEQQKPYFRHFMAEVYDRLRDVVSQRMFFHSPRTEFSSGLREILTWELPERELAVYAKRLAEVFLEQGNRRKAAFYFHRALSYDEKVGGTKKLREELGFFESV